MRQANSRAKRNRLSIESLGARRYLAIVVDVGDESMHVTGTADGPVRIVSVQEAIEVTENGVLLGTFHGISLNLTVELEQTEQDDWFHIDMGDQQIDQISVDLGDGDNQLEITSNRRLGDGDYISRVSYLGGRGHDTVDIDVITIDLLFADLGSGNDILTVQKDGNHLHYIGGDGADTLLVTEEARFDSALTVLGDGDDNVAIHSLVYSLSLSGGDGSDSITLSPTSSFGSVSVDLGSGDNSFTAAGWVGADLTVRAYDGNDEISFGETGSSVVVGNTSLQLGDGQNTFDLNGTFYNDVYLNGGAGDDGAYLADTLEAHGSITAALGAGVNEFRNDGIVLEDLLVVSQNTEDIFVDAGVVEGLSSLTPGAESHATITGVGWNTDRFAPPDSGQSIGWQEQNSDIRSILVSFSEAVWVGREDLRLVNLGLDARSDTQQQIELTDDHLTLTDTQLLISFAPNELPDGVYRLEVLSTAVNGVGNPLDGNGDGIGGDHFSFTGSEENGFYKLTGDFNGDGGVSIFDFPTFAHWFGQDVSTAPEYVDLNLDGGISIFDFSAFAENFAIGVTFPVSQQADRNVDAEQQAFHAADDADEAAIEKDPLDEQLLEWLHADKRKGWLRELMWHI